MRILILLLYFTLARAFSAESPAPAAGKNPAAEAATPQTAQALPKSADGGVASLNDLILLERGSRTLPALLAIPDEGTISQLTAGILARSHYKRQPLNDAVSGQFLDRYIEMLDGLHLHLLQTDLKEFESYRTKLDELTNEGDTRPAREIFARFRQRVEERVAYVAELLKSEQFEFAGNDRFGLDRRDAPHPKDPAEARHLWRQHLRYEYLQEKLNGKKPDASKAPHAPVKTDDPDPAKPAKETVKGPSGPEAKPSAAEQHEEIVKTLARRYSRLLRFWREFDSADVFQTYLTALTHVYDPHSDYLGKASLENFAINMNLALFGIGALLQSEDGYCKVKELKPGPAMKSKKIKPGDRIVAVAQGDDEPVDVVDMKLGKVVEMIRGPKGTKVRLTLIPVDASDPSQRASVTLIRDEIRLEEEEAKAKVIEVPGKDGKPTRLGLIDLPSFYATFDIAGGNGKSEPRSTTADVARLLKKLSEEKVAGVILDLRRNGGGSLEEAINLTGLFIKEGPVVQVREASGKKIVDSDTDPSVLWNGPLVVLTSRFSASASEILAGALQDYGRALIVGDSATHGKGTVQSLIQLEPYVTLASRSTGRSTNNPGALKITVRKFYRASGSSTQLKGVEPDIVLPSVNNYADVGEAALENPLPWDTIAPAEYEKLNRIEPVLEELRKRSASRVLTDKDFEYVREDIERYQKYLADKSVSLNEEVRRREKKENEERLEARKRERKARNEPAEIVHELTLKQVNLPGLPPPAAAEAASRTETEAAVEDPEGEAEEKVPAADVTLKEAKRILLDLIALSSRELTVAGHP